MITSLEIRNIRNIEQFQIKIEKPLVVIEGLNGVGKTTLLESIYFAATTKSHRTNSEKDLITHEKPYGAVKIATDHMNEIIISEHGKRTFINKVEIKKISDYIGKLRVVMFAPEDLMLIKGGPSERRYLLDLELMQVSKEYLRYLNTYKRILKQRNILLKKIKLEDDYTFLDILGEQLYEVGSKIYDFREKFIRSLNDKLQIISKKYEDIVSELIYEPNITKDAFIKYLRTKQKQDILYQQTMVGIHKDDFKIVFNGFLAKDHASQGQQRLIAIEIKLALLEWIKEETHENVILLLDDVLSELDLNRQDLFLKTLPKQHQVLLTSAVPIENTYDFQKIVLQKGVR